MKEFIIIYLMILFARLMHDMFFRSPLFNCIYKSLKDGDYDLAVIMKDGTCWFINRKTHNPTSPLFRPIKFEDGTVYIAFLTSTRLFMWLFSPLECYWQYKLVKWFNEHKQQYLDNFNKCEYSEVISQLKTTLENEKY